MYSCSSGGLFRFVVGAVVRGLAVGDSAADDDLRFFDVNLEEDVSPFVVNLLLLLLMMMTMLFFVLRYEICSTLDIRCTHLLYQYQILVMKGTNDEKVVCIWIYYI
jgi:hypothetical protein